MKTTLTFCLAFILLFIGCAQKSLNTSGKTEKLQGLHFGITGERVLELEPCGCSINPKGGFPRLLNATEMFTEKNQGERPYFIEAGPFLRPLDKFQKTDLKNYLRKAKYLVQAMNEMQYVVTAFTPEDTVLPVSDLSNLRSQSKFSWVSTNMVSNSKKIMLDPYFKLQLPGKRIAKFFALVAPARTGYKMNKDFTLLDPLTSLRQYSQELNDPGTVHILISQLSEEQNKAILNEFPQINWIIQSNASQTTWTQPNEKLFTFQPLNRGRSVIFVSLSNDGSLQKVYSPEGANRLVGNRSYWQANIDAMKNEKNPEVIAKNKPVFDRFTGWLENTKNIPLEKNRDGAELRINTHELEIKYDSKTNAMTKLISDYKAETKQSALSK